MIASAVCCWLEDLNQSYKAIRASEMPGPAIEDAGVRPDLAGYLDYNATTPYLPQAAAAVADAMANGWGNPSSAQHKYGQQSKDFMNRARAQVAAAIGAKSGDIVFTSGGTEANNWVLENAVRLFEHKTRDGSHKAGDGLQLGLPHIIISAIEHPAITNPAKDLEARGKIELSIVKLRNGAGAVHPDDIAAALKPTTALVSIMLVNNETGCRADVAAITRAVRDYEAAHPRSFPRKIIVHTDAAQALGKCPVDVEKLGVDMLTIVGHKFYAPRIGALYVRNLHKRWDVGFTASVELEQDVPLFPIVLGGGQERGLRSGTENVPQCAGLGAAAEFVSSNVDVLAAKNRELVGLFERLIRETAPTPFTVAIHGEANPRVGNVCMFSVVRLEGGKPDPAWKMDNGALASALLNKGIVVGKGAACHSDGTASGVLAAMNVDPVVAKTALRLSVGMWSTKEDIEAFVKAFWEVVTA